MVIKIKIFQKIQSVIKIYANNVPVYDLKDKNKQIDTLNIGDELYFCESNDNVGDYEKGFLHLLLLNDFRYFRNIVVKISGTKNDEDVKVA